MTAVVAGIVNFKGVERTLVALASVLGQTAPASIDVIVVDSGSSPADIALLTAGTHDRAELLMLPENRGYAAACNAVATVAVDRNADFVWFLNNDLTMEGDVLAALLRVIERDPAIAAVAPVTVDAVSRDVVHGAGASVAWWRGRLVHKLAGRPISELPAHPYDVEVIEGASPLIRVESLLAVGAWDESFFMYWEDAEWSVRARRSGARLQVVPSSLVGHAVGASLPVPDRLEFMLRNRVRFMRITAPNRVQGVFILYFALLWLPSFALARLWPRYGPRRTIEIVRRSLGWNITDAIKRRRWRLQPADQVIPSLR